jgi:hypothetical protein
MFGVSTVSGVTAFAMSASNRIADRLPLVVGSEQEARVELSEPVTIARIPSLAAEWGVRLEGVQSTYLTPSAPITIGLVLPDGIDLASVINTQRDGLMTWAAARASRMSELAATMSGPQRRAMEANVSDLQALQTNLLLNGFVVAVVDVRGATAAVERLATLPGVRTVTRRSK